MRVLIQLLMFLPVMIVLLFVVVLVYFKSGNILN